MCQSRNYCFTDFELLDMKSIYNSYEDIIRYLCWGEEICPKTKKKHFQGYIQFKNKKRLGGVKKIFGTKKIHLESCKGSALQNKKYCAKDNKFTELGKFVTQGQRTDLEQIQKELKKDPNIDNIMENHFQTYCRYRNGIKDYAEKCAKDNSKEFRKVEVIYIYGETNAGKTKTAMKDAQFKIEGDNLKWWDGYNHEKIILIDEYDNDIKITKLLNLLDGYQLRLPIKGGFTYANWTKVYITSNIHPDNLHQQAKPQHRRALFRRIDKIIHLKSVPK